MKKNYNLNTTSDIPLEASYSTPIKSSTTKTTSTKPKINAIGKKATTKLDNKSSKTTTSKSSQAKKQTKDAKKDKRIEDLEKLNEENFKSFSTKTKRNKVVIVLLSIAIAIAIAVITAYVIIIKLDTNCAVHVHGANAVCLVGGEDLAEFRSPANLQGNSIFNIDLKLKINESGQFKIRFKPECFQNGALIENTLIYEANLELFFEDVDGYYTSKNPISGNQTIQLCGGIILDYNYENTLNVGNFKLDFHVYLEKI